MTDDEPTGYTYAVGQDGIYEKRTTGPPPLKPAAPPEDPSNVTHYGTWPSWWTICLALGVILGALAIAFAL